jgi:tetratricopeptide (TPR) repeat protein
MSHNLAFRLARHHAGGGAVLCVACLAIVHVDAVGQPPRLPDTPTRAATLVRACRELLGKENAKGAVQAARQAAALDPANRDAPLCLGVALEMLGRHAEAVPPLERVVAERPDDPDALFALANAYSALDEARAEQIFERLAALRPADVDVRLILIAYLWDHGQTARGNAKIERLLEEVRGRPDVRVTYALDLLRQWQFDRAARQLEKAWGEGAATYHVAYLLGNAWWEAGEIERAVESFSRAIAIDPAAAQARHEIGRLLLWTGRPEEAIPHLEKAAAAEKSAATELDLGRSYETSGRLADAERAYRAALALEPSLSPIYYALGRLLKRMEKADEAGAALGKYRQLYEAEQQQHAYETAHRAELDFARQALRRGDAAAARARFEQLGNTPDALIGRANALSRLNRHAEAVQVLERLRLLAPGDQRVEYLLARERTAINRKAIRR